MSVGAKKMEYPNHPPLPRQLRLNKLLTQIDFLLGLLETDTDCSIFCLADSDWLIVSASVTDLSVVCSPKIASSKFAVSSVILLNYLQK